LRIKVGGYKPVHGFVQYVRTEVGRAVEPGVNLMALRYKQSETTASRGIISSYTSIYSNFTIWRL